MDKTTYFESLLRRDFLRYVLLRAPFLDESDVVNRLMEVIDVSAGIRQLKLMIKNVVYEHTVKRHTGEMSAVPAGRLAPWLRPGIANDIMADYASRIDAVIDADSRIARVVAAVERLTWLQGIDGMAAGLRRFLDKALQRAADFDCVPVQGRDRDALMLKYEAAERVTLTEQLTGRNRHDVADYCQALDEYAAACCEEVLYHKVAEMYRAVAGSLQLRTIIDRFYGMHHTLLDMPEPAREPQPAWDGEYRRMVPVDFYERNVESIDGAMAFHMVLLQAFARHEDELRAEGSLDADGELRIFTRTGFDPCRWITANTRRILK